MEVLAKGYILVVKSLNNDKCLMRHPNDVKIFEGDIPANNAVSENSDNNNDWKKEHIYLRIEHHVSTPLIGHLQAVIGMELMCIVCIKVSTPPPLKNTTPLFLAKLPLKSAYFPSPPF